MAKQVGVRKERACPPWPLMIRPLCPLLPSMRLVVLARWPPMMASENSIYSAQPPIFAGIPSSLATSFDSALNAQTLASKQFPPPNPPQEYLYLYAFWRPILTLTQVPNPGLQKSVHPDRPHDARNLATHTDPAEDPQT